jgi:meso-butanediol dehydrogenase/(S,S)-butanediol dehydrogenase/diacetyl reductase
MLQGPLSGRVAVVTGSSRTGGIGHAICVRLAELGAAVVVSDVGEALPNTSGVVVHSTTAAIEECVTELEALGASATGIRCDVTRPEELRVLVDATVQHFGQLDIFVNNAGVALGTVPIVDVTESDLQTTLDINLKGTFLGTQAAARRMIEQGRGGRIINISSQAGKSGWPQLAAYSATKFGIIGLTQSAAKELGANGITVNAVCPGTVDTELSNSPNGIWAITARQLGITTDEARQRVIAEIPIGRLQQPRDVADVVAFLAGDGGAYITGEAVNTTGGQEMH